MYIVGSVLGQFAVHIVSLIYISNYVKSIEPHEKVIDLEKEFKPSLLNSAIYLLQLIQQISTFAINYQGMLNEKILLFRVFLLFSIVYVCQDKIECHSLFCPY